MRMDAAQRSIHQLLRDLGLTRVYLGYDYLFYILLRDQREPGWFSPVGKQLYLDVARAFSTTPAGVDSALRTAIELCWRRGPMELTGRLTPGQRTPPAAEFLAQLRRLCRRYGA